MNSTSREIRRLNIKSFFNRRGIWRCYRCCLSCFCYLGSERLPALSTICLFGCLACGGLEVCLSFAVCLNFPLPFIQLLLFEQDTSVFYLMYYNIPRVEAPLLVNKISKKTSSQSCRFQVALKRNKTKHKLILHENTSNIRERAGYNV